MAIRSIGVYLLASTILSVVVVPTAEAQSTANRNTARVQSQTATHTSAELVKGRLSPEKSKPGDQVELRLKDDVKSNGEVVLKKGTIVTGVVRSAKRVPEDQEQSSGSRNSGQARSMLEIEWLAPAAQGSASKQVMITLQSFSQVSPLYQEEDASGFDSLGAAQASAAGSARATGGGLLGGIGATAGSAVSTVGAVGPAVGNVGTVASRTVVNGQSNAALMSMPSVVAVDQQTTANLENSFGLSGQQQLYKTGRGDLVSATGSRQSVDVFSRMSNDTVLTSRNENFEVGAGAQMQLLVGVEKR